MPRESTTDLRELSMQISRLLDQFTGRETAFIPIINALVAVIDVVDTLTRDIERPGSPA